MRTPVGRSRSTDSLGLGQGSGGTLRKRWRRACLLAGVLLTLVMARLRPDSPPLLLCLQGTLLWSTVQLWQTLEPLTGRIVMRRGQLVWYGAGSGAPAGGPCRIAVCLSLVAGLQLGQGAGWYWVFRDEMNARDWRRLHLLARFTGQNRIRRPR